MSEENMAEMPEEVNEVSAGSSAAEGSEPQATPPAEAKSALESEEQRVPYSRFKEVIEEKNNLGNRISELESQLQSMAEQNQGPSAYDKALERFKNKGLDDTTARVLADSVVEIANEITDKRVSKVEENASMNEVSIWTENLIKQHPDANQYIGIMEDIWSSMPAHTQDLIVSDPVGLELLYAKAKEYLVDDRIEQAKSEGMEIERNSLAQKKAMSGASGKGSVRMESMPSPEEVKNMTDEEYAKVRKLVLSPKYAEYVAKKRKGS